HLGIAVVEKARLYLVASGERRFVQIADECRTDDAVGGDSRRHSHDSAGARKNEDAAAAMRHDDVLTPQFLDGTAEKGCPMSLERRQAGRGQHAASVPRSALKSSVEENVALSELMRSQEYQRAHGA